MYLNAQRLQAALDVYGMFLPTPVGGTTIEFVNNSFNHLKIIHKTNQHLVVVLRKLRMSSLAQTFSWHHKNRGNLLHLLRKA